MNEEEIRKIIKETVGVDLEEILTKAGNLIVDAYQKGFERGFEICEKMKEHETRN